MAFWKVDEDVFMFLEVWERVSGLVAGRLNFDTDLQELSTLPTL